MKLTNEEIQKLLYCIDLIIQNYGKNEDLEKNIYEVIRNKKETRTR